MTLVINGKEVDTSKLEILIKMTEHVAQEADDDKKNENDERVSERV